MVLSMERWKGKVAIVTGAGGGVGSQVVKQLIEKKLQVVAFDLRSDFLEKLSKEVNKNDNLHTFAIDITQEEEVLKLFKKVTKEIGPVNILINCAGIVQQTNLTEGDAEKWRKTFNVNVIGLSIMTREAVKVMKAHEIDGHIIHICSIAGHVIPSVPELNVYPASKHAVRALVETLRQELNHSGLKIKITNVSPGLIDTDISKNNNFVRAPEIEDMIVNAPKLQAADIADGVMYALSTPPHVQVHELMMYSVGETL